MVQVSGHRVWWNLSEERMLQWLVGFLVSSQGLVTVRSSGESAEASCALRRHLLLNSHHLSHLGDQAALLPTAP